MSLIFRGSEYSGSPRRYACVQLAWKVYNSITTAFTTSSVLSYSLYMWIKLLTLKESLDFSKGECSSHRKKLMNSATSTERALNFLLLIFFGIVKAYTKNCWIFKGFHRQLLVWSFKDSKIWLTDWLKAWL